ncbi:RHS repeat-associated core domain-containing protein [Paenibacillus kribbensis]|uniref:DUF6531 domain-containing protein n=1 Tax=Paenibacillus kribbensis TaxID=172713 RepID=UPI002DBEE9D6|nr:DUF6531 domain-containing protein [Paenibacillus kribbensis]MEC0236534.1 RHS repeat-associated core domain-containing protein [Paenibacillus kribbensis]
MLTNQTDHFSDLTVQNLLLKWPYGRLRLEKVKLHRFPGVHSTLQLQGIMSQEDSKELLRHGSHRDQAGLYLTVPGAGEYPLFLGQLHVIDVKAEGVHTVCVDIISHSYQLDIERKSRSFQKSDMLYTDVLHEVFQAHPGSSFLETDAFERGATLGNLLLQYEETDWEFIQRVASITGAHVTPDVNDHTPRIWIGTPTGNRYLQLKEGSYQLEHQRDIFLNALETQGEQFSNDDFTRFQLTTNQWLELGWEIEFDGRAFVIAGVQGQLDKGVMEFDYTCTTPAGFRTNRRYNENLAGLGMEGKILAIGVKKAKVHLDIDREQPENEAVWFPYSSPTSNIFHAMPPVGSRIKLYFPTSVESDAMLINSVRTPFSAQGESAQKANQKMADSTVKSFSTGGGKEFELGTTNISFTAKEGALLFNISEKGGITFLSDKDIVVTAPEEIEFSEMKAFRVQAEEELWLVAGNSSYMMHDETEIMGPNVIMTGTQKQAYEALSDPAAEQAKSDKEKDSFLEKLGTALDVLSMVPGLGTIAGAASAVVSLCRGDFLGAALSIGSMIPFGGSMFGAAKLAAKGAAKAVAKTVAKAAVKAGGKVAGKIGRAAAKNAIKLGKNTMNKVLAGARKLKHQADELQKQLAKRMDDMQKAIAERSKNLMKKALEKSGASKRLTQLNHKVLSKFECTKGLKDKFCQWGFEPVDLITGRMVSEASDFEFPGPLPLSWERRWISDSHHEGWLGHGVHHVLDMRLEVLDDCIGVLLGDGRAATFERLYHGLTETRNPIEKMVLRRQGAGYALTEEESRLTYSFGKQTGKESGFRLERIELETGRHIALAYNEKGFLQQVTDSVDRIFEIDTDHVGRITRVTHVYVSGDDSRKGEVLKRDVLVQYEYNEVGDLAAVTDALGQTTYMYYDRHLMIQKKDRNGYSFHWRYDGPTTGARCIHTYGDDGLLEGRIAYFNGWNEVTNSQGQVTRYEYTPEYYCTRILNPLGGEIRYLYSDTGELLRIEDADGRVTGYTYDAFGRMVEETQPDEGKWQYLYDSDGRLKQMTDPEGRLRSWIYDVDGRVVQSIAADETVTRFVYDEQHRIREVHNPQGAITELAYDEQDNLVRVTLPDGTSGQWSYNQRGECEQEINPLGAKQCFVYDALGRVVRTEMPDGNVMKLQYNAYDDIVLAEDHLHRIAFGHTPLGDMKWSEQKGRRIELVYNQENELIEVVNEKRERYMLERDANGQITRETGFDGIERRYIRSAGGLLQRVERPDERWTCYEYDQTGRINRAEYSDGLVETFVYNRMGELVETSNPFTTVKLEYDQAARVVKEWRDDYWVSSQYDTLGNRLQISSSLGASITMERDLLGQVSRVQAQQTADKAETAAAPWMAQMKYNALGQELERLLPGGVVSSWQYDVVGRPEQHSIRTGGRESRSKKYEWDVNNRLKMIVNGITGEKTRYAHDEFDTLIGAANPLGKIFRMSDEVGNLYTTGQKTDRKYGSGGRLLEYEGIHYSYDEEGNLIHKTEPDGTHWQYEYYGNGMMSKVIRPDGQEVTFKYDSMGRRIEKHFAGVVDCFVWDGNNILHEWKEEDSSLASNRNGEPAKSISSSVIPESLITWVFEDGTFHPAAKITGQDSYSIVTDHLGTPVEMYDEAGSRVWASELDIYGNVQKVHLQGKRGDCPFRYPGQYEDEETGLYYNRFRYYSPHEGMYTQQDPIGISGGFVLYGYVHDPSGWVDVLGLTSFNTLKGDAAEQAYKNKLQQYGYKVFMEIKNNSNNGTDIIAQHMGTNKVLIFEVKANSSRLSRKQRGRDYIKDIFNEIQNDGKLRGQKVDRKTIKTVEKIKKAINNYGMSSYEVHYKVDSSLQATYKKIKKWCQNRP